MSRADGPNQPRAMIHRRILDVAASNPDASLAGIASEVSGASESLVGRVLDEYGDPAGDEVPTGDESSDGPDDGAEEVDAATGETDLTTDGTEDEASASPANDEDAATQTTPGRTGDAEAGDPPPDESDETGETSMNASTNGERTSGNETRPDGTIELSEKQRETLRTVRERPDASQADIADVLDVTRATVSRRLNSIPGFEWSDRQTFAERVFDGDDDPVDAEEETERTDGGDADASVSPGAETGTGAGSAEDDSSADAPQAGVADALDRLDRRLSAVESEVEASEPEAETPGECDAVTASLTPELAHKVLRACMESDRLTEDEELALIRSLVGN